MSAEPSQRKLKEILSFAEKTAHRAGKILKEGFAKSIDVEFKGRIDPVTEYDYKAEEFIVGQIRKQYQEHSILSEEGNDKDQDSSFQWVIDPIDGTVNYRHKFPVYCVSIGLQFDGESVLGVVYDPERDETFSAIKGKGAKLNGKTITVSSEKKLQRALLATGFAYNIKTAKRNNLGLFARMAKKAEGIRRPGSAAIDLCWLAAGRIDGFWELYLHPWDTAAASLIVTEAGGKISRVDGSRYSIFDDDLLASNGKLHKAMKDVLTPG